MNYSLGGSLFRNGLDLFEKSNTNYLRTDIYEKEDAYYLKIEVPGFKKEDLEVGYENGYLTVTARENTEYEEELEYIRKERVSSEMQRMFYIGDIKEDSIKANYENGILTVRIEKNDENTENKRQIVIE